MKKNLPALVSLANIFQTLWWVNSLAHSLSGSNRSEQMDKTPPVPRISAANPEEIWAGKMTSFSHKTLEVSVP